MDMAHLFLDAISPAHGPRPGPLHLGSLVDIYPADEEVIDIKVGDLLLGVGDGRAEDLLDDLASLLFIREMQDGQRLSHKPVPDEVRHQPGLLGRDPDKPGDRMRYEASLSHLTSRAYS